MSRIAPAQMDQEAIENEIAHLENYFSMCADNEQGISTKDSVRMRQLKQELASRTENAIAQV